MVISGNRKGGRGFGPAFFFVGLAVILGDAHAEGYAAFGRFETQLISEPEAIKATLSDWGEAFDKGERQWAVARIEAGVRFDDGLEISIFSRALADLRMNEKAVAFYGKIARAEALEAGQTVPVKVDVNGFIGHGFRLGYLHEGSDWLFGGGLSLFSTSRLMSGNLNGRFTALSDSDYDFNADVEYVYYRDVIFKRPDVEPADGIGWSLDFATAWRINNSWRIAGSVEDLLAGVSWQDAPYTRAQANTAQKTYDERGFAVFRPLISGVEGYRRSYTQELDPRYKAELAWFQESISVLVRGQYQFGYGYAGVGAGYATSNNSSLNAVYWPETESLSLELSSGAWRFGLAADQIGWSDMRALSLSVSYGAKQTPY